MLTRACIYFMQYCQVYKIAFIILNLFPFFSMMISFLKSDKIIL